MPQVFPIAPALGGNLATTLMVCITVFRAGNGQYGVMPLAEYDVGPTIIIQLRLLSTLKRVDHVRWRL